MTTDSSKLQIILTVIAIIVAIKIVYLNYRKKPATTTLKSSQSVNDSLGVIQQNHTTIGQQTINFNPGENVVSPPTINLPKESMKSSIFKELHEYLTKFVYLWDQYKQNSMIGHGDFDLIFTYLSIKSELSTPHISKKRKTDSIELIP